MFGSKSNFFHQKTFFLIHARNDLRKIMELKNRRKQEVEEYLNAFDFFCKHPHRYDGATIVKDLIDLNYGGGTYLDADAMLHDYDYIMGANSNLVRKWKKDLKYIKYMERNGKGIRAIRFVFLTIIGVLFVPYVIIKNKLKSC